MTFDVTRRLAEGIAAVDNTQLYVQACVARGYHHPDLTLHAAQIRDWYGSEDGLDLRALEADCVTLQAVRQQTADALDRLRAQTAACDAAWSGEGGSAATEFLTRHVSEAAHMAAAVEKAAVAVQRLCDDLWRLVDGKVDATVSIDDRTASQRPAWSAAARGDGSPEIVDTQIRPYVEATIAGEWVPAMRAARDGVEAAYRSAVDAVSARPPLRFAIPGELVPAGLMSGGVMPGGLIRDDRSGDGRSGDGRSGDGQSRESRSPSLPAPGVAPFAGSAAPAEMSTPPASALPPSAAEPTVPQALPLQPAPAGTPAAGRGAPAGGLTDALGSLFDPGALSSGGTDPWAPSTLGSEDRVLPDNGEPETEETAGDEEGVDEPDIDELREKVLDAAEDVAVDTAVDDNLDDASDDVHDGAVALGAPPAEAANCPEVPAEVPAPPVTEPVPDAERTPCEIAADELPQVGE